MMFGVVYIDDDPNSRLVLQMVLERVMGFREVLILPDAADLASQLQGLGFDPQVFLVDIHMQPVDGFAVLRQLRADERYSKARIVALTASVMNEEVATLRDAGFDSVVGKPVDMSSFPDILMRIAGGEAVWRSV